MLEFNQKKADKLIQLAEYFIKNKIDGINSQAGFARAVHIDPATFSKYCSSMPISDKTIKKIFESDICKNNGISDNWFYDPTATVPSISYEMQSFSKRLKDSLDKEELKEFRDCLNVLNRGLREWNYLLEEMIEVSEEPPKKYSEFLKLADKKKIFYRLHRVDIYAKNENEAPQLVEPRIEPDEIIKVVKSLKHSAEILAHSFVFVKNERRKNGLVDSQQDDASNKEYKQSKDTPPFTIL